MQCVEDAEALARLRRYLRGFVTEAGTAREERLRSMLPAVEPMAWKHFGQPRGESWRRLLVAIRIELAAYRAVSAPVGLAELTASEADAEQGCRVVHIPDDTFDYPIGTRLDVVGALGSDAVDVEPSPFGRYLVASSERQRSAGRTTLTLTLRPVR